MTVAKNNNKSIDLAVPLKIRDKGTSIVTKTINIAPSGAYCNTLKPLPLLSKVVLTLLMPRHTKTGKPGKKIECRGTVVRTHPVVVDGQTQSYDVAIYFDELSPVDKRFINKYIEAHLSEEQNANNEK